MRQFQCIKDVFMEDGSLAFSEGRIYQECNPEIWPPDTGRITLCLKDNKNEDHFWDFTWHKFFKNLTKI